MNIPVSRRAFMKASGAGVAGTALGAFGFGDSEKALAASVRPFKLARLTEVRNTCPYCSVGCGIIMYSKGDLKKGEKAEITHIEGDSDHPTNKGTLCPKGAALLDFVKSETRTKFPMVREPGTKEWKRLSWDQALDRIARLMKEDRDANFIELNKDGTPVNRWPTMGFLSGCATTNETGWVTYKLTRGLGIVQLENQARI
jgi:formate dehydrogenase major subunit